MPWNGNGLFTRVRNWVTDKNSGIKIVASLHDSEDDNLAAGIQACLTKNNENKPTADFRPSGDNNLSLGSPSLRWLRGFFSGGIRIYANSAIYGEIQSSSLTASRNYDIPDASGMLLVKDASKVTHDISGIGFTNSGFESVLQSNSLSANRNVYLPDDNGNLVLESSTQNLSNKTFVPEGSASGQTGTIRLRELAANGNESIALRAPDALGTSYILTLPNGQGGAGTTLSNDGTGALTWQAPNSTFGPIGASAGDGGRVQLQELSANGTHVVRIKAPDSIVASFDLTMPAALPPVVGAGLSFSTTGLASFTSSPMATRQHADESAFIFSLLSL